MRIHNQEGGVRREIVAALVASGITEFEADMRADAALERGCTFFCEQVRLARVSSPQASAATSQAAVLTAISALHTWALQNA